MRRVTRSMSETVLAMPMFQPKVPGPVMMPTPELPKRPMGLGSRLGTAPTAQLLVVGADHGALTDIQVRVAATGVDAAVHLAGHLTGRDLRLAYAAADLFAAPGRTDSGSSAPAIDALASGLPVLGDASEVMRAAADAGVGRVPLARVDAWTDALQQTWLDLSARPARRDTARQVASQFGWMAAAEAMERAYARALPVRP